MIKKRKSSRILTEIISNIDPNSLRRTRDKMCIAARIADALENHHLTQKEFAKMMNKSESEISDWLSGDRNFTVETLSDIDRVLDISLIAPYVKFHCIAQDKPLICRSNHLSLVISSDKVFTASENGSFIMKEETSLAS